MRIVTEYSAYYALIYYLCREPTQQAMKKIITWLKESHRLSHFGGGFIIGILSNTNYCAALAGCGVAGALELKDRLWGGKWEWLDFGLTLAGVTVGRLIRIAVCGE